MPLDVATGEFTCPDCGGRFGLLPERDNQDVEPVSGDVNFAHACPDATDVNADDGLAHATVPAADVASYYSQTTAEAAAASEAASRPALTIVADDTVQGQA